MPFILPVSGDARGLLKRMASALRKVRPAAASTPDVRQASDTAWRLDSR